MNLCARGISLILRRSFAILLLVLSLFAAASCSRNNCGSAPEVQSHFLSYFRSDSSEVAVEAAAKVRTLDCRSDSGADSLRRIVNDFTRQEIACGDNFRVIKYMRELIGVIEEVNGSNLTDKKLLISACIYMGVALQNIGMSSLSLDYYNKGLLIAVGDELRPFRASLLNNIGVLYFQAKEPEKALGYLNESLKCNSAAAYNPGIFLNYINLAMLYQEENKIDKSLDSSLKAMQYIVEKEQPEDFYAAQVLLGDLYSMQGNHHIAMSFLRNALMKLEEIEYMPGILDAYEQLSKAYRKRNMPDSAALFAGRALALSRKIGAHPSEASSLKMLAGVCGDKGDYGSATQMLKAAVELEDSLRTEENRMRLRQWEGLGGGMTAGSDFDARRYGDIPPWVIVVAVFLALAAAFFVVVYYRRRLKLEKERSEARQRLRALSEELDLRNRELTTLSLDKIKSREGIDTLCDELREVILELNPKATAQRTRLRSVLGKLDSVSTDLNDDFRQCFERVHPDFYRLVKERYPNLTPKEERLCAFLYLGLSTKEIAALTWREIRSVESSRNRLRKKLQLELSDDLHAHLKSIAP